MVSIKQELDLETKKKPEHVERKDPTSFLPDEPMSYEIKEKKRKKKRKKQEDPFKDLDEKTPAGTHIDSTLELTLDPEVSIKVENIEVELDFNDFANTSGLMVEGPNSEDSQEPVVKLEEQNKEAVLLTFESIINNQTELACEQQSAIIAGPSQVCKVCHLVFQSTKTLEMHQKRKHKSFRKSFKHICDYCGMSYEMKNSLVSHIKRKHAPGTTPDDNEERTCDICALVFKGITRLRMHMRRKHGSFAESFKHECEDCGLTYDKYRSLIVHRQRKHLNDRKPVVNQWFNCPFCPKAFSKRETYSRHVQRKHKVSEEETAKAEDDLVSCRNEETGEITCKECPLVFSTMNFLKLHMRRKHNALKEDFRLKCRICNLSYDKIESLKRHIRRKHDNDTHCEVCNKKFDSKESYINHSHIKVIKECNICGLIFASQGGLAKHMRCTHKIDSPNVTYCHICNKGFHDKRQLKPHLMKVHMKVSYTCKYCKKVFKAKESYRRHVLFKHPVNNHFVSQMHQCDQCPEKFTDEFELCRHINLTHGEVLGDGKLPFVTVKKEEDTKDLFQCTKCPDVYSSFEQIKLHYEQNHHYGPETQCQLCGEMMHSGEVQKHIKNVHTVTSHTCKYCEFKTTNKTSMTQHVLRHKNATTLHCDFSGCKYKSYYDGAMQKHKQKHEELGVKLQCSKCPFQTMNKYILKYHEEAHMTGKKRYACDQCDYSTILPANLVQHKYKHSNEKRFKCEVCPFATKYNTSLRFHVKKKHCDLPSFS
ncbi:unnamed protein product [Diatraea saccharalis]|uniref:C2H2-type domain-containing protein n=1 Tax=Diatraea saccharalis TaxID=40085 RepID=A0A9N9R5K9_9NEOP|nr:unnamed protein product [Diatraea saccharalis]